MNFPEYPPDINTPEALMIVVRQMANHATTIGALDWVTQFREINNALFWTAEVKRIIEEQYDNRGVEEKIQ